MLTTISSWIISIAGVICISVIVELILPNGQMNRYIKGIFAFIIILVIIMPLPKLLNLKIDLSNLKIDLSNVFNTQEITLQDEYLEQLNLNKLMMLKEETEKDIEKTGYSNVVVSINADIFAKKVEIKSVYVDISQIVINEKAPHKDILNIRKLLAAIVKNNIGIEEGKIYFDG